MEVLKASNEGGKRSALSSPKKGVGQIETEVSTPNFTVGSFPPGSDPTVHTKAKPRYLVERSAKQEVIHRRHSSQLNFNIGRTPFLSSSSFLLPSRKIAVYRKLTDGILGSSNVRNISTPIRMSHSSSSSISLPDSGDDSSDSESASVDDSYIANMMRSSGELTTKTAPESGRSMMTAVRERLRNSREAATATTDTAPTNKANDIYQKYLKQHRLEGWLLKQTRNPERPDSKYNDKPWRRRWVTLGGMI